MSREASIAPRAERPSGLEILGSVTSRSSPNGASFAGTDRAVPLSPLELQRKRIAIFKHESQKDKAMFPGTDSREFWQRAEDRNRETALTYDKLGLPEYEGIEGFVLWDGDPRYA